MPETIAAHASSNMSADSNRLGSAPPSIGCQEPWGHLCAAVAPRQCFAPEQGIALEGCPDKGEVGRSLQPLLH